MWIDRQPLYYYSGLVWGTGAAAFFIIDWRRLWQSFKLLFQWLVSLVSKYEINPNNLQALYELGAHSFAIIVMCILAQLLLIVFASVITNAEYLIEHTLSKHEAHLNSVYLNTDLAQKYAKAQIKLSTLDAEINTLRGNIQHLHQELNQFHEAFSVAHQEITSEIRKLAKQQSDKGDF